MTDQQIVEEDAMERLQIMLHQEEHIYACPDYFSPSYRSTMLNSKEDGRATTTPLTVVEECAKLVTDLSLNNSSKSRRNSATSQASPNDVVRGPTTNNNNTSPRVPHAKKDDACLVPWRCQMCAWAYTVVDTFQFSVSVVAVAFNLLDRYLALQCGGGSKKKLDRQDFQLYSMTAVYLAVKIYEPSSHSKLTLETLTDMSRGFFTACDFQTVELDMLQALQWRTSPPTSFSFCAEFQRLLLLPLSFPEKTACRELLARSVGDAYFVPRKASLLAVAAIMLVVGENTDNNKKEYDMIRSLVDVTSDEYKEIYKHLKR